MKNFLTALLLMFSLALPANASGTLLLLVDISFSITPPEMETQKNGYAKAFSEIRGFDDKRVIVITFGSDAQIEYDGPGSGVENFFLNWYRSVELGQSSTRMSRAIKLVEQMMPTLEHPIVVDISGDGTANGISEHRFKPEIFDRLDVIESYGARVNVLLVEPGKATAKFTADFYSKLTRGGGFMLFIEDHKDFALAIHEKLVMEVAMLE